MSDFHFEEEDFQQTKVSRGTLMRILAQVKPYKWWVVGFLGFVGGVSALDSIFTYLTKQIIDVGIIPGNRQALTDHIILFGVLYLLIAVMVFGFIYLAGVLGERVRYDMRKQLFNHLQALSFDYFDRTPVGWIMSRVTSDTERIADLVTWGMLDVTWALMNIATATFFMLLINWQLALIVFM
ncbi:MAG: ABC transporter ATP-binding protein, partial [Anaerolineae bacterium]|nr:ABC transporter ATP-binding protein [Anaerolineae bacterium]